MPPQTQQQRVSSEEFVGGFFEGLHKNFFMEVILRGTPRDAIEFCLESAFQTTMAEFTHQIAPYAAQNLGMMSKLQTQISSIFVQYKQTMLESHDTMRGITPDQEPTTEEPVPEVVAEQPSLIEVVQK